MSEVLCKGVVHWCTELAARRSDHELVIHDDLQRRLLGFHDNTDETVFYLGLHFLQKAEEGDTDALRMSLCNKGYSQAAVSPGTAEDGQSSSLPSWSHRP